MQCCDLRLGLKCKVRTNWLTNQHAAHTVPGISPHRSLTSHFTSKRRATQGACEYYIGQNTTSAMLTATDDNIAAQRGPAATCEG